MHTIFQCAERWELTDKNPIKLVRVKGGTKRLKTPRVLAPEQFELLVPLIREGEVARIGDPHTGGVWKSDSA
jgi:hypothetical protein